MLHFLLRIRIRIRNINPTQFLFHNIKHGGGSNPIITSTTTHLNLRFIHNLKNLPTISQNPQKLEEPNSSFSVSYLINSCHLSPQSALSAAKFITIKSTENPDSVLKLFKSYGFTDTQIATIITKRPELLAINPDTIIKPKLDFFLSFSGTQSSRLISSDPFLLGSSLERRLKPNLDLLTSVIGSNRQIVTAVRRNSRLFRSNLEINFLPNVRILQGCGVRGPSIAKLATNYTRVLKQQTERFKVSVESIKKLGFDPLSGMFVEGLRVMSGLNTSTWDRKVTLYKSLGWSEGEIISAFTKRPSCMLVSDAKIRRAMDFFVKKMYWEPSFVAAHPILLKFSLEKRVIPWCSVVNILASKGVVVVKKSPVTFLVLSERDFLTKYVIKYQDRVPEVLQAYNGDLGFVVLEGKSHIVHGP